MFPSLATMASTRVAVVDEKSNSAPGVSGSLANTGGAFMPNARSTKRRPAASSPRSSKARA